MIFVAQEKGKTMDDLISRQAAIDAIRKGYPDAINSDYKDGLRIGTDRAIYHVEQLPSAQPKSYREGYQAGFKDAQLERKKGTWIIKDNPGTGWYRVTCSECGEDVTSTAPCIGFYPNAKVTWDYCPNCGADMRGEQDE